MIAQISTKRASEPYAHHTVDAGVSGVRTVTAVAHSCVAEHARKPQVRTTACDKHTYARPENVRRASQRCKTFFIQHYVSKQAWRASQLYM